MKTQSDVKAACRIDEGGHWIFAGSTDGFGGVYIQAPDFTADASGVIEKTQRARRAVWHIKTRLPIPIGHHIYSKCGVKGCIKPGCLLCLIPIDNGARLRASGCLRGSVARRLVARTNSQGQRKISDAAAAEIRASGLPLKALASQYGVHISTVVRVRRGSHLLNMFSGLMV